MGKTIPSNDSAAPTHCAVYLPRNFVMSPRMLSGSTRTSTRIRAYGRSNCLICSMDDSTADLGPAIRYGAAIVWPSTNNLFVHRLLDRGVRVVSCNRDWAGTPGVVSIGTDLAATARLIFVHLAATAPVRIVMVYTQSQVGPTDMQVRQAVRDAAVAAGFDVVTFEAGWPGPEDRRSRMTDVAAETGLLKFLKRVARPTSVWCANDYLARMVCNAAAHLGLRVPERISVLGMGDFPVAVAGSPTLSSLPRQPERIGHAAARTVFEWVSTDVPQPADVILPPPPIVVRESTRHVSDTDRAMSEALRIINAEACGLLTVQVLCERIGFSKVTVSAKFLSLYGFSPGSQIRRVKLERAKRLLIETQLPISDVGNAVGFDDQSKFARFFKQNSGLTPSGFRARRSADVED